MGKRGPKPKGRVKIKWSSDFAYAIGLLTTDGCLYSNGRHISLVSKDVEQLENFMKALSIKVFIGKSRSGLGVYTPRIQFSDVLFHRFLKSIGITPNKSKQLASIKVPTRYFFDFLRGHFDGDGSTYSYFDPRWRSSFMFYTTFVSASEKHVLWLQEEIYKKLKARGHITKSKNSSVFQLKYAKTDSRTLLRRMYSKKDAISLSRKRLKVEKMLSIVREQL